MRRIIVIGAGLTALYLVLINYTGFGKDLGAGQNFVSGVTKTFQGR
jgi:hypothetical protein